MILSSPVVILGAGNLGKRVARALWPEMSGGTLAPTRVREWETLAIASWRWPMGSGIRALGPILNWKARFAAFWSRLGRASAR